MKRKVLRILIVLTILLFLVATAFFFLMKNAEPSKQEGKPEEEYNVDEIVEKIEFLKLNTYDEIKKYADEYPIYIQASDDKAVFAIGELYIEDIPVKLFYNLNEDGTINRFDGYYSVKVVDKSADELERIIACFNSVVGDYFGVGTFVYDIYDESGMPISSFDEQIYEEMFAGKATYGLSIVDKDNTYWYITAAVSDGQQVNFEFFRCFDLSVYSDETPNIDLRVKDEIGE